MTHLLYTLVLAQNISCVVFVLKAKFHYASWFEAGTDRFEASNRLRTSQRNGIFAVISSTSRPTRGASTPLASLIN